MTKKALGDWGRWVLGEKKCLLFLLFFSLIFFYVFPSPSPFAFSSILCKKFAFVLDNT